MMELIAGLLGGAAIIGLSIYVARLHSANAELKSANAAVPLYREALKRQHAEITNLHKALIATASADELAGILNKLHEDDNGN